MDFVPLLKSSIASVLNETDLKIQFYMLMCYYVSLSDESLKILYNYFISQYIVK